MGSYDAHPDVQALAEVAARESRHSGHGGWHSAPRHHPRRARSWCWAPPLADPSLEDVAVRELAKVAGILAVQVAGARVTAIASELNEVDWDAMVGAEDALAGFNESCEIAVRAVQGRDPLALFPQSRRIL